MGASAAASADGNSAAAVSAPGNRPMTEMAAPVMGGGPPPPAMTPAYGAPSPASAPIAIPAGPAHGASHGAGEKKGGMGLVIGLGALAILLIGGGIAAYALKGKTKPATGDPLADLSATASAIAVPVETASVPTEDPAGTHAPLGASSGAVATGTTVKTATGTATKPPASAAAIPTPKIKPPDPPRPDPPICAKARDAAKRNSPAAANLIAQCKSAGGTL
jgi:hypothetical protein